MPLKTGIAALAALFMNSEAVYTQVTMTLVRPGLPATKSVPPPRPQAATFDGWITFSGEFQLYPKRENVGRLYDRTCISGYFRTKRQQIAAARRYAGKHVRIEGSLIPLSQYWSPAELGSPVENYCDSVNVLVARSITTLP